MAIAPSGIWYSIPTQIHQNNDPNSITRFKQSLEEENILNYLNTNPLSDLNENYNSSSKIITKLKVTHLPNKKKKI